jgi:hypothetical protein
VAKKKTKKTKNNFDAEILQVVLNNSATERDHIRNGICDFSKNPGNLKPYLTQKAAALFKKAATEMEPKLKIIDDPVSNVDILKKTDSKNEPEARITERLKSQGIIGNFYGILAEILNNASAHVTYNLLTDKLYKQRKKAGIYDPVQRWFDRASDIVIQHKTQTGITAQKINRLKGWKKRFQLIGEGLEKIGQHEYIKFLNCLLDIHPECDKWYKKILRR